MKISILISGTRGDVQPYLALGKALKACGHNVLLACPDNFLTWVEGHGLKFQSIGIDMRTFLQSPKGREALFGNLSAFVKIWRQTIIPSIRRSLDATWEAARNADTIIFHPKTSSTADDRAVGVGRTCL